MAEDKHLDILTLREAARFIRVSDKTLGEMAREKRIPSQKVGREWRFLRAALERWLSCERATPAQASDSGGNKTSELLRVHEPQVQYELNFAGFRDTAFSENHNRALHRWVPWIAGFSASFVQDVLGKVAARSGGRLRVLDPFAGVGTTLIEAMKTGHNGYGFEINPYAALACQCKVSAVFYDVAMLTKRLAAFERHMSNGVSPKYRAPEGFKSRTSFFSARVEHQVLCSLDFMEKEKVGWIRDLFRVALGSVMVSFSNYSYEPSLGTRSAAGKPDIEDADVADAISSKLRIMIEDIRYFQRVTSEFDPPPRAKVRAGSFFDLSRHVPADSIDALITSPPYLNNYHYIRNTRPHMFWLGMVKRSQDLKEMELKSFGNFWQTVRTGPEIKLEPDISELSDLIRTLRMRNYEKGPYGGPGWANYAASYFNDCARFCRLAIGLMRPGGTALVVIGNNILQGIEFPTDRFFAEIAKQAGFDVVDLHTVREKRTGDSIVNSSVRVGIVKQRTRLYETAVELRAPR